MPTGYTADISATTTFKEFALRCARNFGALILMRDDAMDAPIPEAFEPSDYHRKALDDAKSRLAAAKEMTVSEAARQIQESNQKALSDQKRVTAERDTLLANYRRMAGLVEAWQEPSLDHRNMKKFMLDQLRDSIEWDCPDDGGDFVRRCYSTFAGSPADWIADCIRRAEHDLEYHTKHEREEQERTAARNLWVKQLRESLK